MLSNAKGVSSSCSLRAETREDFRILAPLLVGRPVLLKIYFRSSQLRQGGHNLSTLGNVAFELLRCGIYQSNE